MAQFLPRGYRVSAENRIKKLVAGGNDWQIFLTNVDSYVLAVKPDLYRKWVSDYLLPTGIFTDDLDPQYWIFQSSGHYIISSIENGPYPEDNGQVEAFSIAFKTATDILSNYDISDAIYIEESRCQTQYALAPQAHPQADTAALCILSDCPAPLHPYG